MKPENKQILDKIGILNGSGDIQEKTNKSDFDTHLAENATETQKGHIQLATQAEVTTGTEATKVVTPKNLKTELDKKIDKSIITAAGDIPIGTGNSTLGKLAKGAIGQALGVKADGNVGYINAGATILSGSYYGDNSLNRVISIGVTPKAVFIISSYSAMYPIFIFTTSYGKSAYTGVQNDIKLVANGFQVSSPSNGNIGSNYSDIAYDYIAIC